MAAVRTGTPAPAATRTAGTADREVVARAAAEAVAEGKSGKKAAQEVVSRSGDRWGTVYDQGEYAAFAEASTATGPASASGPCAPATAPSGSTRCSP
ncbi:hypothetical protein SF23_07965, partial [Streptomyces sp. MBRL 10]